LNTQPSYASAAFWTVESGDAELPVGAIAMWSALNGSVPANWAECDGTANAPGPDLRNFFIVGRGTKTVDTSGGAATHVHGDNLTHTGTAVANHVFTQPSAHGDHSGVPSHVHLETAPTGQTGGQDGLTRDASTTGSSNTALSTAANTGAANQIHTNNHAGGAVDAHGVTQPTAHGAHAATNHEPAWYALLYIQRMS